MNYFKLFKYCR